MFAYKGRAQFSTSWFLRLQLSIFPTAETHQPIEMLGQILIPAEIS